MITQAFVLSAGLGTRLRPLTNRIPKAMIPIGAKPLLERNLNWLKSQSVRDVVINLHWLPDQIEDYFGKGRKLGLKISYSREPELLGTAGGVIKKLAHFTGDFWVIYGDNLVAVDLKPLAKFHGMKKADVTIGLYHHPEPWTQGIVSVDKSGRIKGFVEKPPRGKIMADTANAGIYLIKPAILASFPKNQFLDFGADIFPRLLKTSARLYGLPIKGYVQDTGTLERYRKAQCDFKAGRVKV